MCKAESITLSDSATVVFGVELEQTPASVKVIVSHGDCVLQLPPAAVLLASSVSCVNEIFAVGRAGRVYNILACQSHPEFEVDYAIWERLWPAVVERNHRLSDEEVALYEPTLRAFVSRDADPLNALIKLFLHRDLILLTESSLAPPIASMNSEQE